ncbi:hypothetical protein CG51_00585 [Haematobacter missouriensis]|uniref:Prephenate dehydrogenase n=1 Tax=Haematobacter missouriensis TaxID=366616 RepID=A0A212AIK1_9RHOB|nr:prephenate dehydrogenase/arogenate dehydrogenase family protein [Haematobacter missouriensis]KFI32730.1 hypothetical protein CG51_00585 [Haematobacter missouriensis]OWJ79153.1 prephenate dehydrogenase [Haematobacter missouriensis]OWJ81297.1 prephenate dehydrogenase [Haematobacter missouriensis]
MEQTEAPEFIPAPLPLRLPVAPAVPRLGLIGCGAFGGLIAPRLAGRFALAVHDPARDGSQPLEEVASADIVVLAVPLAALAETAEAISPHLRPGALVVDVCSVKLTPLRLLEELLPAHVALVGSHPLFGPKSFGPGARVVLCPARGGRGLAAVRRWLRREGMTVLVRTAEAHDRDMALAQGITHMVGRIVAALSPEPDGKHGMTTPSFEHLLTATGMVAGDAQGVFETIQRDNPFVAAIQQRFFAAAEALRGELAGVSPAAPAAPPR